VGVTPATPTCRPIVRREDLSLPCLRNKREKRVGTASCICYNRARHEGGRTRPSALALGSCKSTSMRKRPAPHIRTVIKHNLLIPMKAIREKIGKKGDEGNLGDTAWLKLRQSASPS